MIKSGDYNKLKKILLEEFENKRVCITLKGMVNTSIVIDNTKIIINKHKIILSDENNEFELEFLMVKKIQFDEKWHIQIFFDELKITIEV